MHLSVWGSKKRRMKLRRKERYNREALKAWKEVDTNELGFGALGWNCGFKQQHGSTSILNQVLSFYACISSCLIVEISEIRVFYVNRVLLVFRLFVSQYICGLCLSVKSISLMDPSNNLQAINKQFIDRINLSIAPREPQQSYSHTHSKRLLGKNA